MLYVNTPSIALSQSSRGTIELCQVEVEFR